MFVFTIFYHDFFFLLMHGKSRKIIKKIVSFFLINSIAKIYNLTNRNEWWVVIMEINGTLLVLEITIFQCINRHRPLTFVKAADHDNIVMALNYCRCCRTLSYSGLTFLLMFIFAPYACRMLAGVLKSLGQKYYGR